MLVLKEPTGSCLLCYVYSCQQGRLEVIVNEVMEHERLVEVGYFFYFLFFRFDDIVLAKRFLRPSSDSVI